MEYDAKLAERIDKCLKYGFSVAIIRKNINDSEGTMFTNEDIINMSSVDYNYIRNDRYNKNDDSTIQSIMTLLNNGYNDQDISKLLGRTESEISRIKNEYLKVVS